MPQDCPPGRVMGQAPTQSCRCQQAKRVVGLAAVSATGTWGRSQQCPPRSGESTILLLCTGGRGWGLGGGRCNTQQHTGPDSTAATSPRVPTSPDPCQPPLLEQGPRKGLGTGRLCGITSRRRGHAMPWSHPWGLTPRRPALRRLTFPRLIQFLSPPASLRRGRLWHQGWGLHRT